MAGPTDDIFKTGGAFSALSNTDDEQTNQLRDRILSGYKVGEVIGVGGMGHVLHATRAEGDFEREAAIKVVVAPLGTSELVRHFRREVQILAKLNHPSIAQLYDAGETEEGWPYLAMEYVDGQPIDEYCADKKLPVRDRLKLLMDVAAAVQFAHARLVIHRDIKPSNVLVDADGKLKLLDFGIAKLLEDGPDEATRTLAMTPQYASPEQLLGQPIGIASDVYQLGLLITKVLGGSLPTDGETLTDAIQRSAEGRLLSLPAALRDSLPDEIVLIIEQCLRAEPAERYQSANYLRDDLLAYVTGHPVRAAGQRSGYRLRKFVRRNWGGVLTGMLTILALVSATIVTTLQTVEAKRQRDVAVYQQQRVQATNEFYSLLLEEMGSGSFTSVDLLDRGKSLLEAQFGSEQPFMAAVLFDVSKRYANLGEADEERALLAAAEKIARGQNDVNALASVLCGSARNNQMASPELAAEQLAEGMALHDQLPAPTIYTSVECFRAESNAAVRAGEFEAALQPLYEAIDALDRHPAPGVRLRGLILGQIAFAYFYDGQPGKAIDYLDQTLELYDASGRGATLLYQRFAANKAVALQVMGRAPEALATFATLRARMETSGFRDRGTAVQLAQYAAMLVDVERYDDASNIYDEALAIADDIGAVRIAASMHVGLAKVYLATGRYDRAREELAVAAAEVHDGQPRPLDHGVRTQRAKLSRLVGNIDAALQTIEALLAEMGYPDAARGGGLNMALAVGAEIHLDAGDTGKAAELATFLIDRLAEKTSADSPGNLHLGNALLLRATVRLAAEQFDDAIADVELALPHLEYALGSEHPVVARGRGLRQEAASSAASL
ncbi:MAG: serine/threonine-protein kinase [Pseudomonadota bacterium]